MNKILLLTLSIFLINLATAQLTIDPQPLEVETQVNQQISYLINIFNPYNFEILDFQFGNLKSLGFTFPNITIPANQSKSVTIIVLTTSSIHQNLQVPVSFRYFVELSSEPETHNINIEDPEGFLPNYLPIHQGDTIIWKNKHSVNLDLVIEGATYEIPVNSTIQHTFNNLGTFNYYDIYLGYSGTIEVLNKTSHEKAHNPNYDINWVVNINSILNPTNLSVDNSKKDYEIEYGKFKKGLLTITNNGSEKAELIKLTSESDWISFNKNNIDIEPGEEDWVEYSITPIVFSTNETDKTYTLNIKVKASNSGEYTKTINVFVPFKEITNTFGDSDVDTLNWLLNVFCPKFPTSFLCNQSLTKGANGSVIYTERDIPINVSKEVIYEIKKNILKLTDSGERTNNELKILADKWGITLPELERILNQSLTLQVENEKKTKTQTNVLWILGFFTLLILVIGDIIRRVNKRSFKKGIMEGPYKYRR